MQGALILGILWAQWTNPLTGNTFNNPISSSLDTFLYGKMQERIFLHSSAAQQGSAQRGLAPQPGQRPAMPVAHKSLVASDFQPVGPGHPTLEAYLSSPSFNPDARRTMRAMFDTTLAALSKARRNNVATALAGALGVAMGIVSERPLSVAAAGELIMNVNDLLAESRDFARLRPDQKQSIYETLVMTTALLAFMQQAGQTNPSLKAPTRAESLQVGAAEHLQREPGDVRLSTRCRAHSHILTRSSSLAAATSPAVVVVSPISCFRVASRGDSRPVHRQRLLDVRVPRFETAEVDRHHGLSSLAPPLGLLFFGKPFTKD